MRTREITRTREQGTETTNTCQFDDKGQARIDAVRRIVERSQYSKIDGVMVDLFSASTIVSVYDALGTDNQAKFRTFPVGRMASIAFKLCA